MVADFATYVVSLFPSVRYQETFVVVETCLLLLLCTVVFFEFMQSNMQGTIIVSIKAFHSNDLESALG